MHYAMSLIVFICVLTPLFSVNSGLFTVSNTTSTHTTIEVQDKVTSHIHIFCSLTVVMLCYVMLILL